MGNKTKIIIISIVTVIAILIVGGVLYAVKVQKNNNEDTTTPNTISTQESNLNLASKVEIGDYVNYIPDSADSYELSTEYTGATNNETITQEDLKWRVLSKDESNGEVILVAENPTTQEVSFGGANGYNNAVYLLNDICKNLYSKTGIGTARSIKIEDIAAISDYDLSERAETGNVNTISNANYPNILTNENNVGLNTTNITTNGLTRSNQSSLVTGNTLANNLTVKNEYYNYSGMNTITGIYYDMLINNGNSKEYFVASRYLSASENYANFGISCVISDSIGKLIVYRSNDYSQETSINILPVITLTQNIQTSGQDNNGAWNLAE